MKTIKRPEPIQIGTEGATFSFDQFVGFLINTDARFNSDGAGIRSSVRIEAALKAEGDLRLEDEDQARLTAVANAPSGGYPTQPARSCLPFVEAIEKP